MSAWNPPNTGYRCDRVTGVPLESKFDPSEMPSGTPPTFRILGSNDPIGGAAFAVVDTRTMHQYGWRGPQPDSES